METVFKKKICYRHIINIIKFEGKLIMRKALNFDLDTKNMKRLQANLLQQLTIKSKNS